MKEQEPKEKVRSDELKNAEPEQREETTASESEAMREDGRVEDQTQATEQAETTEAAEPSAAETAGPDSTDVAAREDAQSFAGEGEYFEHPEDRQPFSPKQWVRGVGAGFKNLFLYIIQTPKRLHLSWLTLLLSAWFIMFSVVIAYNLRPLPDEPPRINFWGLFYAVMGVVAAIQLFFNRARLFQLGMIVMLGYAYFFMAKRIKFLEMMLEPNGIEQTVQYTIPLIILVLLLPRSWRTFNQSLAKEERKPTIFSNKGVPF